MRARRPRERPVAAEEPSLAGKTIGVAVVGTQHFWDREAYNGAVKEVEALGGQVIGVDGGRTTKSMPTITTSCWRARSTR